MCVYVYVCVHVSMFLWAMDIFDRFYYKRIDGLPGHLPFGGFLGRAWESGTRPREAGHRGTAE